MQKEYINSYLNDVPYYDLPILEEEIARRYNHLVKAHKKIEGHLSNTIEGKRFLTIGNDDDLHELYVSRQVTIPVFERMIHSYQKLLDSVSTFIPDQHMVEDDFASIDEQEPPKYVKKFIL